MFEDITTSILQYGDFSGEEIDLFLGKLRTIHFKEGDYLLNEGQVSRNLCFINHGSFRHYQKLNETEELTHGLLIEKNWALDYKSFISQKPSETCIQAFEDCEVLELNIHDLHDLIEQSKSFFRLGRLLENALENTFFQNGTSPEEKYINLLENRPGIIQRFPLKYIASYLRITPETLSRTRRKITL